MAEKPKPPAPPATSHEAQRRVPLEPLDAIGSKLRHLPAAARLDPIHPWKRAALASALEPLRSTTAGIQLRVTYAFVLMAVIVGSPFGVVGSIASLATVFSVVLAQELPGALLIKAQGGAAKVVISAAGAQTETDKPRSGAIATVGAVLAGSIGNLLLALLLSAIARYVVTGSASLFLSSAAIAHAVWGVSQAIPLLPFRAGRAVAKRLLPATRLLHAGVSFIAAGAVGLIVLRWTSPSALFFAWAMVLIATTIALWEASRAMSDEKSGVGALLRDANACWQRDEPQQAVKLAKQGLGLAHTDLYRARLWRTLAWAAIGARDPFLAHSAIGQLAVTTLDLHLVASYLDCCNRRREAIDLLKEARCLGHSSSQATRLLIDLLFREGRRDEARLVAMDDARLLTAEERHAAHAALQ
jgi:hypothetical protein